LLADAEALADLGEAQSLGQVGLGLPQLGDDFLRRVSLHGSSPGPAGPQRLSYHLDHFLGSRPGDLLDYAFIFKRPALTGGERTNDRRVISIEFIVPAVRDKRSWTHVQSHRVVSDDTG